MAARKETGRDHTALVPADPKYRSLYAELIRLHVVHHAAKEAVYGFATIEELRRHGSELSSGALYPILHGLGKGARRVNARMYEPCAFSSP